MEVGGYVELVWVGTLNDGQWNGCMGEGRPVI